MKAKKQTMILFLAVSLLCMTGQTSAEQSGKPNVLFIAIDDLNDWTDTLKGNPQAKTPHMDKLASQGMVFSNAHCAAPACGSSRFIRRVIKEEQAWSPQQTERPQAGRPT